MTGELGRWCVNLQMDRSDPEKTERQLKDILAVMQMIYDELQYLNYFSRNGKKQDQVKVNIEKVRNLLLQSIMVTRRPRIDMSESRNPELKKLKLDK